VAACDRRLAYDYKSSSDPCPSDISIGDGTDISIGDLQRGAAYSIIWKIGSCCEFLNFSVPPCHPAESSDRAVGCQIRTVRRGAVSMACASTRLSPLSGLRLSDRMNLRACLPQGREVRPGQRIALRLVRRPSSARPPTQKIPERHHRCSRLSARLVLGADLMTALVGSLIDKSESEVRNPLPLSILLYGRPQCRM